MSGVDGSPLVARPPAGAETASAPAPDGEGPPADAGTRSFTRWLPWAALPLAAGASGLTKVRDPDVWWRVRTGELIWTTGSIPTTDPFSHTAEGPWNCVEPAANLLLFAFHATLGPAGLSWATAAFALVLGTSLAALVTRAAGGGAAAGAAGAAAGLALAAAQFRFGPKPDLLSFAAFGALLALLHEVERRRSARWLWLVPPLVLLWGSLHRSSALALPVLLAAVTTWGIAPRHRRLVLPTVAALTVTALAVAVTPGMVRSYASSAGVVSTAAYVRYLPEWQPLTPRRLWEAMPALIPLGAAWFLLAPVPRRLHFGTLVALGTGVLAWRHARLAPFFAVALAPEVAWGLARALNRHRDAIERHARPGLVGAALWAVGLGALAFAYLRTPNTTWGPGVHHFRRPAEAARFLATHPPPGRMYNSFNYGSYLLYALAPAQPVFIDGRNDQVYRPEFFAAVSRAPSDAGTLAELVRTHDVSFAVLECTSLVTTSHTWLYRNPDWTLVYLDDQAAVMVREAPATTAYLREHGYDELRPDTALLRVAAPRRDPRSQALAAEVLRHVAESPRSIRAHLLASAVHLYAGRPTAAGAEREIAEALARERGVSIPGR